MALTETGHANAVYPLSGCELLSTQDIAALIAARAEVSIGCEQISVEDFVELRGGTQGLPHYIVDGLSRLFYYYSHHPLAGNDNMLRWLLGREPTTVAQYLDRTISGGTPQPPLPWATAEER